MFDVGRSMLTVRRRRIRRSLVSFPIRLDAGGQRRRGTLKPVAYSAIKITTLTIVSHARSQTQ
jgi:hypothetical protein